MNFLRKLNHSVSKQLFILLVGGLLAITSCNKEKLDQSANEANIETNAEIPALALEKLIVENAFRIPVEALSDEQILAHYEEYMQLLSEEDRLNLITNVENALIEGYNSTTSTVGSVANRTSETILSAGNPDDGFGQGVATVGNKVYVGVRYDQKVNEYAKTGGNYNLINEILPGEVSDGFGFYVSVSGSWMAVSAPDFTFPYGPGKVFMFKKQGNAWVQQAVLNGPAERLWFGGRGLVLKGNTLAVGGNGIGGIGTGSYIYVYELNGNNWTLSETIHRPGYDFFEIDMDNGGNRIVGTGAVNNNIGTVRASIFVREGSSWVLEDEVFAPFGSFVPRDVAIYNNTVVITAVVPGSKSFVFSNNAGDWEFTQELNHPGIPPQNRFVDMSAQKIVIGAASSINFISDAVYVFEKSGGEWSPSETYTIGDNGADKRIWSVAISGNTIVAGLPGSSFAPVPPGSASVWD